ncbi:tetratricopeptide repeat protein [Pokkaliibacter sp. CJK22405]|uniref:tetratricopeptide repeat protein n=1 Tax=Pokkaliibacter sp. CJK22405 TaxID=3384615 RepID=UPI00398501F4
MSTLAADLIYPLVNGLVRLPLWSSAQARQQLRLKGLAWCACRGHVRAQSQYGHFLYFRGRSSEQRHQGVQFIIAAAQAGDVNSQYQAALLLEQGSDALEMNTAAAIHWYQQAGEQGHVQSVRRLIQIYSKGELGVNVDGQQARYWMAKDQRHELAS